LFEGKKKYSRILYSRKLKNYNRFALARPDREIIYCSQVLYKIDVNGGVGSMYERTRLEQFLLNRSLNFDQFRKICILSGCDYLPSVYGVGLITAQKAVLASRNFDVENLKLVKPGLILPPNYAAVFRLAERTFESQPRFDLKTGKPPSAARFLFIIARDPERVLTLTYVVIII